MSATRNVILWLVLWLLWTLLAYPLLLKDCCGVVAEEPVETTSTAVPRAPIDFSWSIAEPNTNDGFDEFQRGLLAQQTDNNVLEITGLYFEEEPKPEGYENMGLARAALSKAIIAPDLPDERVHLRSRLIGEREGVREGYFESLEFRWIQAEATVAPTVEEIADRMIVRFPFNSTEKDYDPAVDEYVDKLAERLKESNAQVRLVGHTDNVGSDEANMVLSDRRAKGIRDILIGKGVDRNKITTEAKGETQPVASNDTDEGRHHNRRVEIFLIENN